MRTAITLFAAVLVVLAGCGDVSAPEGGGESDPTPAAVPTDHPMDDRPPGVGRHGLSDPIELADIHEELLAGQNYTVHYESVTRYSNGTVRSEVAQTLHHGLDEDTARTVYGNTTRFLPNTTGGVSEYWANGSVAVYRFTADGALRYATGATFGADPYRDRLYSLLAYVRDGETTANGSVYRVHTDETPSLVSPFFADSLVTVDSWDQTVLVDPDGHIRSIRIEFGGTVYAGGESVPVTGSYDLRFTDVGSTTVDRPDWVPVALNETRDRPTNSLKHLPVQVSA